MQLRVHFLQGLEIIEQKEPSLQTMHEEMTNYQCEFCDKSFANRKWFEDHIKQVHEGVLRISNVMFVKGVFPLPKI